MENEDQNVLTQEPHQCTKHFQGNISKFCRDCGIFLLHQSSTNDYFLRSSDFKSTLL